MILKFYLWVMGWSGAINAWAWRKQAKIIKDKHFGVIKTQIFDTKNNLVVDGTGTALHEEKL